MRTIQDWIVRRQLLGVEGVADVSSFGGKLKQYEVAVDANNLILRLVMYLMRWKAIMKIPVVHILKKNLPYYIFEQKD